MRKLRLLFLGFIIFVLYFTGLSENIEHTKYMDNILNKNKLETDKDEKGETLSESIAVKEDYALKQESSTGKAEQSYIKEYSAGPAVFLGDSITEGLYIYGYYSDSVIKGINSLNTVSAKVYVSDIAELNPSKLFILLGINDIWEGGSVDEFIKSYNELLLDLKFQAPLTHIYVEALFPVSEAAIERNPQIDNNKIDIVNSELKAIASKLDIDFIDVNTPFKDENGNMKREYSNDGVHIIDVYYHVWTDILDKYIDYDSKPI